LIFHCENWPDWWRGVERVEKLRDGDADGEITTVRYDWKVETTKQWMNLLAPIARPFFNWNHNVVMGWGGEGLAKRLGVEQVL